MFKNTRVVLLTGHIGAGKTTVAHMLYQEATKRGYNSTVVSFAGGVKAIARMMGWTGLKDERGRKLLIDIGMAGRAYNEDIWAHQMLNVKLPLMDNYPFDFVFVDDWRFKNELDFISQYASFTTIPILIMPRSGLELTYSCDPSEQGLPKEPCALYKYTIMNNDTPEKLQTVVCPALLNTIIEDYKE